MISLSKCKSLLNISQNEIDDDKLTEIRDFLYSIAELQVEEEKNKRIDEDRYDKRDSILQG